MKYKCKCSILKTKYTFQHSLKFVDFGESKKLDFYRCIKCKQGLYLDKDNKKVELYKGV